MHSHESEQMTYVLQGALKFLIAGEEITVREGEVLHIPSWVEHQAEALDDTFELDLFSPIRQDWLDTPTPTSIASRAWTLGPAARRALRARLRGEQGAGPRAARWRSPREGARGGDLRANEAALTATRGRDRAHDRRRWCVADRRRRVARRRCRAAGRRAAVDTLGAIDILVTNTGGPKSGPFDVVH